MFLVANFCLVFLYFALCCYLEGRAAAIKEYKYSFNNHFFISIFLYKLIPGMQLVTN